MEHFIREPHATEYQIGRRPLFLSNRTTARRSVDLDTESFDAMSRTDRLLRANDLLAEDT